ncbi:carbohydrate-binding family 9-like protein [Flavobacterium sp. 17A]|uniref:Carbohydrate-binding family 9-like protein n=1 Tax=Flavobacterium potami TaxID=2872310 RepID=A0A9X1KS12_9FLAO|nr:carbohydrate-binding family 9-like protein [Flavobacterium potami]MBZ4037523.1 carbohydrate-binding family 9-like protein [Flavobacterium potami]
MKNYEVNSVEKGTLQINGFGDHPLWEKAAVLTDFISPWENHEPKKIELRALWDSENVFFYYKVWDNEVYIDKTDDTAESIANSDRVEIFLRKDADLSPYYCFEIDPEPRILDFIAFPNRNFDYEWKWPENHLQVKSNQNENYFTVEIAISIESLKQLKLLNGNTIEAGFYRAKYIKQNETYEPVWITWVNPNTPTPDFHIASSFGKLILIGF